MASHKLCHQYTAGLTLKIVNLAAGIVPTAKFPRPKRSVRRSSSRRSARRYKMRLAVTLFSLNARIFGQAPVTISEMPRFIVTNLAMKKGPYFGRPADSFGLYLVHSPIAVPQGWPALM